MLGRVIEVSCRTGRAGGTTRELDAMSRGQRLLLAQRRGGKPLGAPPGHLGHDQLQAWADIVRECHDVLRQSDRIWVEMAAMMLAHWRDGSYRTMERLRMNYRAFGKLFVPMAARRRMLFGFRH